VTEIQKRNKIIKKRKTQTITSDSFTNFIHKLGKGTGNQLDDAKYSLSNLLSRDRTALEAAYRGSWLIGQAVDVIAEDMTKVGIDMVSKMPPDAIKKLQVALTDFAVWESLCNVIKWSRLYGGAMGVILIDGAKYDQPLDLEKVGRGTFKGILVLDRWMCEPLLQELITDWDKDFGKPKYYRMHSSVSNVQFPNAKIHHTRVMRFDGVTLPFHQKYMENYWGLSVVERIYDRLLSYDSATLGAAQLMYKAYLRIVMIDGLREKLALGGSEEAAILAQFNLIRQMQGIEGITLLDKNDAFQTQQYSFGGVADILREFGQQISGATGIPLVRLFGQSPAGFSTGDADLRNYYDNILREQENKLRPHLTKLLEVISLSILGQRLPEDFEYNFISLWQMTDKEKSEIANSDMSMVQSGFSTGLISKEMALRELQRTSRVTGRFTNITDEDLEKAKEEDENQPPPGLVGQPPPGIAPDNPLGAGEELSGEESLGKENVLENQEPPEEQDSVEPVASKEKEFNSPSINLPIKMPVKSLEEYSKPIMKNISEKWKKVLQNIGKTFKRNTAWN